MKVKEFIEMLESLPDYLKESDVFVGQVTSFETEALAFKLSFTNNTSVSILHDLLRMHFYNDTYGKEEAVD